MQELIDLGNLTDENDDGTFCLKAVSNLRGASVNQWGVLLHGTRQQHSRELDVKSGRGDLTEYAPPRF